MPTYRSEQSRNIDVGTDYRVQYPFETKIGNSFQAIFEGIDAGDIDGAGGGKTFAGKKTEEGGLTGAISFARC